MISVVIPLYNKAASIAHTIASVRAQTVADWELIIVDDGSTDDGPVIVQALVDPRIRLIRQANAGVSAARNRGVAEASATWVAFLDADDHWAPDHLENLLGLIARYPHAAMCATAYYAVDESGEARKNRLRREDEDSYLMADYFADAIEYGHPVSSISVAVTKARMAEVGGFPVGVKAGEDIITWARLACAGDVAYSGRATAYYIKPPVGKGARASVRRPQTPDYVGAALAELRASSTRHQASLQRFEADWHRIRGMLFLELNERRASLAELSRAVKLSKPTAKDGVCCAMLLLPLGLRERVLEKIRRHRRRPQSATAS